MDWRANFLREDSSMAELLAGDRSYLDRKT